MTEERSVAIVGIGNRWRRDDGVGLVVAECLRGRVGDSVPVHEQDGDPIALSGVSGDTKMLVIVDSMSSGEKPGAVRRLDVSCSELPEHSFRSSTHLIGLADSLELARTLGRLPGRVIVFGVEGTDFSVGEGLSPPVEAAVPEVVEAITQEVGAQRA